MIKSEADQSSTREILGKKHGVGSATIGRDAKFAAAVDALPEADKEIVLSGKSGQTKKAIAGGPAIELHLDREPLACFGHPHIAPL